MRAPGRSQERRRVGRPRNGDTKLCPKCAEAMCDFNERYRIPGLGVLPAWLCDSPRCRYRDMVRLADKAAVGRMLIRESRKVQGRAKRQMLKARFLTERSQRLLKQSAQKKA